MDLSDYQRVVQNIRRPIFMQHSKRITIPLNELDDLATDVYKSFQNGPMHSYYERLTLENFVKMIRYCLKVRLNYVAPVPKIDISNYDHIKLPKIIADVMNVYGAFKSSFGLQFFPIAGEEGDEDDVWDKYCDLFNFPSVKTSGFSKNHNGTPAWMLKVSIHTDFYSTIIRSQVSFQPIDAFFGALISTNRDCVAFEGRTEFSFYTTIPSSARRLRCGCGPHYSDFLDALWIAQNERVTELTQANAQSFLQTELNSQMTMLRLLCDFGDAVATQHQHLNVLELEEQVE
ncbi:unnamed protein product [Caenorhabditis angaria]|uniref:Uncharacterized protein n=1 Tax=Caenorhabditis angaria TaxID=860376 RepID=A0A9P1MXY5_9PELO|nr:unnamed protein product [Caenorhabditis angaria]